MANKRMKTLQLPGLSHVYTFVQADSTLTQAGEAADAKATGDALAAVANAVPGLVAETFATNKAYTAGSYVYYNGSLYRFTADHAAGAWIGSDATAVKLADDVGDLRSAFDGVVDIVGEEKSNTLDLVSGNFVATTGATYADKTRVRTAQKIYLEAGDKIAVDSTYQWMWARYNEQGEYVEHRTGGFTSGTFTVENAGYYMFALRNKANTSMDISGIIEQIEQLTSIIYVNPRSGLVKKVCDLNEELQNLEDEVDGVSQGISTAVRTEITDKIIETELLASQISTGTVSATDGSISSGTSGYTEITVEAGEDITVYGYYITSKGLHSEPKAKRIANVYATDSNGNRVESGCRTYPPFISSYHVPDGVTKIKFNFESYNSAYNHNVFRRTLPNGKTDRYLRQRISGNPFRYSGALSSGTVVSLGFENAVTNKVWTFTGLLSGNFGSIKIGTCNFLNNIVRPYIEVTPTQVKIYSTLEINDRTFNHGLTITNDFQLIMRKNRSGIIEHLIIQSNGNRWTSETGSIQIGDQYYGIGASTEGAFSKCTLSASILDIDKPVWVFGDSWVSLGLDRWVGQMINLGYDAGWLLSGHPGETSEEALAALNNLIAIRQPEMIVWCMGMNDEDVDNSTPNAKWLSAVEEVKDICERYDITLVLCNVPTVPATQGTYSGTARNNNAKNSYIASSGYRYVDAVTALGADTSGNWIDGYWHNDNDHTHPSEAGAQALMVQFMADVPEMLNAFTK